MDEKRPTDAEQIALAVLHSHQRDVVGNPMATGGDPRNPVAILRAWRDEIIDHERAKAERRYNGLLIAIEDAGRRLRKRHHVGGAEMAAVVADECSVMEPGPGACCVCGSGTNGGCTHCNGRPGGRIGCAACAEMAAEAAEDAADPDPAA